MTKQIPAESLWQRHRERGYRTLFLRVTDLLATFKQDTFHAEYAQLVELLRTSKDSRLTKAASTPACQVPFDPLEEASILDDLQKLTITYDIHSAPSTQSTTGDFVAAEWRETMGDILVLLSQQHCAAFVSVWDLVTNKSTITAEVESGFRKLASTYAVKLVAMSCDAFMAGGNEDSKNQGLAH